MALQLNHLPLIRTVAIVLLYPGLTDKLCSFERLCPIINALSCYGDDDAIAEVDVRLLKRAFKDASIGEKKKEYISPYNSNNNSVNNVGISVKNSFTSLGYKHYLFIRMKKYQSVDYNEVGRYRTRGAVTEGSVSYPACGADDGDDHPLSLNPSLYKKRDMEIIHWVYNNTTDEIRNSLIDYLKAEKKNQLANQIKNQKAQEKKAVENNKQVGRADDLGKKRRDSLQTPDDANSGGNNSGTSTRGDKKRTKTAEGDLVEDEEDELQKLKSTFTEMQSSIEEKIQPLLKLKATIAELIKKEQDKENENNDDPNWRWLREQNRMEIDTPITNAATIDKSIPIRYVANGGMPGKIDLNNTLINGVILKEELEEGLNVTPPEISDHGAANTRKKRQWVVARFGKSEFYVPSGTTVVSTQFYNRLTRSNDMINRLRDLFDGERCHFSEYGKLILTVGGLFNYGGSDESLETIMAMVAKAIFYEIKFDITHKQLASGIMSRKAIANGELNFATKSLVKVLYEIKHIDGAKYVTLIVDHGHRAGQDHYVILLVWAGWDREGRRAYKTFNPSIDSTGHKAKEAVDGIKLVVERFLGTDGEVKVIGVTSDTGGGAGIQNMEKRLRELKVLADHGNVANCVCHGESKGLEIAHILTMGKQGMGKRSPSQLLYSFSALIKGLKGLGKIMIVDELWVEMKAMIEDHAGWQEHAAEFHALPWEDFLAVEFGEEEREVVDRCFDMSPRGMQEPVWTRWQSIIKITSILLDNWISVYFIAVTIQTHFQSKKALCKIACSVVSLMNEREAPIFDDDSTGEDEDESNIESTDPEYQDAIESINPENEAIGRYEQQQKPTHPTFYVMLLWQRAFCEHAFNRNWTWTLQNHYYFGGGVNSHGHLAPMMAERSAIIRKQAHQLLDGGWKNIKEFDKYRAAVESFPVKVLGTGPNRKFFEKDLPQRFVKKYLEKIDEHILKRWWNDKMIYYMLGGDPVMAKEFAKMCVHYKSQYKENGNQVDDEGNAVNADITDYSYATTPSTTTLGAHHIMFDEKAEPIKLDVKETLQLITNDKDFQWHRVLDTKFVNDYWEQIVLLAAADGVVDLFRFKEDGKTIDESSWEGKDFVPLLDGIWRSICVHAHHQQRCENFVQLAALIAKTKVGEVRRTWRAIAMSVSNRAFNTYAVEKKRAKEEDPKKKKEIKRVEGAMRIEYLSEFVDELLASFRNAELCTPPKQYQALNNSIKDASEKASTKERAELVEGIIASMQQPLNLKAGAKESGYDRTSLMDGKVPMSVLTRSNGKEQHLNAEFLARDILKMKKFVKKYGEDATVESISITERRYWVKYHEALDRIDNTNEQVFKEDAIKQVDAIKPWSEMVKELLTPDEEEEEGETE